MTDDKKSIPNAGNADWPTKPGKTELIKSSDSPVQNRPASVFACDSSQPKGRFNARWIIVSSPIYGSSPAGPPQPVCVRTVALPIPLFSKQGHSLLIPHSFPFRRILDVSDGPFNSRIVASPQKSTAVGSLAPIGAMSKLASI